MNNNINTQVFTQKGEGLVNGQLLNLNYGEVNIWNINQVYPVM